jgi:hypothetical protein
MDRKFQIWLKYPDANGTITFEGIALSLGLDLMRDYKFRVVMSRNELIEKISIFDSGLDDRIIEVSKLILWHSLLPGTEPPKGKLCFAGRRKRLLKPEELEFAWFDQEHRARSVALGFAEGYQSLESRIAKLNSTLLADEPKWRIVDQEYAFLLARELL